MNRQQALNQLRLMQAWHEDFGNGPCPDYDAICYAINIIEAQPKELDTLIKDLEAEHKKLREMQKALKNVPDTNVGETISRQAAIDDIRTMNPKDAQLDIKWVEMWLKQLPPAQPEPCEDAVSKKDCLQALSHLIDVEGFRDGWAVSRANVECMLKAMPPVTPKQRTGHWIPVGMVEAVGGESAQWGSTIAYHKCSECDGQALRDDFEQEVLSKWCPHCGAKMEGEAE